MKLFWGLLPIVLGLTACGTELTQKAINSKSDVDSFTTEGKPTKTIETVLGPREIYDPVKDPVVIAAFEDIFNDGTLAITTEYDQATTLLPQIEILVKARDSHSRQLAQYCRTSGDSSCTTFYHNFDYRSAGTNVVKSVSPTRTIKKSKVVESFESSHPNGAKEFFSVLPEDIQYCSRKTLIISSNFKPIGVRSGQPKNEQLNEFFETFCLAE